MVRRGGSNQSAQSLIEVTVGIIVLVPIVLAIFDLSVMLWGAQCNDAVCRNAARAAASGDPSEARRRALGVIMDACIRGKSALVSNPVMVLPFDVKITSSPSLERDDLSGQTYNPGGAIQGSVAVTTEVEVHPIMLSGVFCAAQPLRFRSHQSFPITYVMTSTEPLISQPSGANGDWQPI